MKKYFLLTLAALFSHSALAGWLWDQGLQTCFKNHRTQIIELESDSLIIRAQHGRSSNGSGAHSSQFSFQKINDSLGPLVLGPFFDLEEAQEQIGAVQAELADALCMDHPLCQARFYSYSGPRGEEASLYVQISRLLCVHIDSPL